MDNLLIDLSPLKSGGGVQLALNFLDQLEKDTVLHEAVNIYILIPDKGPLIEIEEITGVKKIFRTKSGLLDRFIFEYFSLRKFLNEFNIDTSFTFFGAGLPTPDKVTSVVGVAYPIICYPESDFWKYLDFKKKLLQKVKNRQRVNRLRQADVVITETRVMKGRIKKLLNNDSIIYEDLSPAPSAYLSKLEELNHETEKDSFNFLFLSGNSPHKNLWRLIEVARSLEELGCTEFKFILSMNREQYASDETLKEGDNDLLERYFEFLGHVSPKEIALVYGRADCLVNLSDLESFSNNYMEAWKAKVPLIVSDRDFAREICGESALYVEPHDSVSVANKMMTLMEQPSVSESLIKEGSKRLKMLPTQQERYNQIKDILNKYSL